MFLHAILIFRIIRTFHTVTNKTLAITNGF